MDCVPVGVVSTAGSSAAVTDGEYSWRSVMTDVLDDSGWPSAVE